MPAIHAARADCSNPTLRLRVRREFRSFDPADARGEDGIITRNLLAPLVRFAKRQGSDQWRWERHLVDSISDSDPKRYTFTLRDEGWRNASSVSAEDVAFSFARIAGLNGGLRDANNRQSWAGLKSVDISGQRSAAIVLESERPDLLTTTLPGVAGCVVNKSYVSGLSSGRFTFDPGPTSGRYDLCDVVPGDYAKLIKDRDWKGDGVEVESAIFRVIRDDKAAKEMFLAGQIDVYRPDLDVLKVVVAEGQQVTRAATSRTSILVLNQDGPLANFELRRAIQLAVNRRAVGLAAYQDEGAQVATGLIPEGWTGWSNEPLVAFDPDEAARIVAANPPSDTLRIATFADQTLMSMALQVQQDLTRIGLRSEVIPPPPDNGAWLAIGNKTADILVTLTAPQTFGALQTFSFFTTASGLRWNANPEFDKMFETAVMQPSSEFLFKLQSLLVNSGVVVPMVDDHATYVVSSKVTSAFNPDGQVGDLGSWAVAP
ncbi:ABC transporter substrate-binding protein [Aminobacter sp. NyZ550]|uniref:ABC transporter substrate-binding protein n=1 Tax=Aminobacter sp. NyZ550 TaxID=2979870 RepID=UPI0021D5EA8C|nr:ABC transporter substrate-binding protein [Aminobacter sp. NyZ550]WAX94916.1 ABC transporter substrate-binding protein [Aminobacter sp. NyZ550]